MPKRVSSSKITSKGQLTVPKEVRLKLGVGPGDELEFIDEEGTLYLRKKLVHSPFARYVGYLRDQAGQDPDEIVRDMPLASGALPADPGAARQRTRRPAAPDSA